jgi:hypothetical protein
MMRAGVYGEFSGPKQRALAVLKLLVCSVHAALAVSAAALVSPELWVAVRALYIPCVFFQSYSSSNSAVQL